MITTPVFGWGRGRTNDNDSGFRMGEEGDQ